MFFPQARNLWVSSSILIFIVLYTGVIYLEYAQQIKGNPSEKKAWVYSQSFSFENIESTYSVW